MKRLLKNSGLKMISSAKMMVREMLCYSLPVSHTLRARVCIEKYFCVILFKCPREIYDQHPHSQHYKNVVKGFLFIIQMALENYGLRQISGSQTLVYGLLLKEGAEDPKCHRQFENILGSFRSLLLTPGFYGSRTSFGSCKHLAQK